jgi:hypothetical protein
VSAASSAAYTGYHMLEVEWNTFCKDVVNEYSLSFTLSLSKRSNASSSNEECIHRQAIFHLSCAYMSVVDADGNMIKLESNEPYGEPIFEPAEIHVKKKRRNSESWVIELLNPWRNPQNRKRKDANRWVVKKLTMPFKALCWYGDTQHETYPLVILGRLLNSLVSTSCSPSSQCRSITT